TYLGGGNDDLARGLAVRGGQAYVVGDTISDDFPTMGPYQSNQTGSDVFVTKFNPAGTGLVYSTYLGGGGDDYGRGIAVDAAGNAYVTGSTFSDFASGLFPTTAGAFQTSYGGNGDAFVAKLSASGNSLVYSSYL